jgi:hypothetical protein
MRQAAETEAMSVVLKLVVAILRIDVLPSNGFAKTIKTIALVLCPLVQPQWIIVAMQETYAVQTDSNASCTHAKPIGPNPSTHDLKTAINLKTAIKRSK